MNKEITLDKFGTLKLFLDGQDCYWFGRVRNISPDHEVELTINVDNQGQSLKDQMELIAEFANNYGRLMITLYNYLHRSFALTGDNRSVDDLKKMYFLASVELRKDNKEWWIVLEPDSNVDVKYNVLPRFTVRDGRVAWSNIG